MILFAVPQGKTLSSSLVAASLLAYCLSLSYFAEKRIALQRNYSLVVWKMNHFLPGRHSFKYKSSDYAMLALFYSPSRWKKRRFAGKEPTPISKWISTSIVSMSAKPSNDALAKLNKRILDGSCLSEDRSVDNFPFLTFSVGF